MICLLFASDDIIPGKHNQTAYWVLILTTNRAKTHRHTDKCRSGFLKHKRVKHFLSNLSNITNETSASWYDVMHDDDFRRIPILKRSLIFFLAFCDVIYQNLLHGRVYIAVSSSKLLFVSSVKNCRISPDLWDWLANWHVPGKWLLNGCMWCVTDNTFWMVSDCDKPFLFHENFTFSVLVICLMVLKISDPFFAFSFVPSVLWCCWLGGRKGIQPVKTEWWGTVVVVWSESQMIMVALWNRADHYIFILWFLLSSYGRPM